jgi:hypothetical protein
MVVYAKQEKVRRLRKAMDLLLQGRRPKEVKDLVDITYQDMVKVGLIERQKYVDKVTGNTLGWGAYVCTLTADSDYTIAMEAFDEVMEERNVR